MTEIEKIKAEIERRKKILEKHRDYEPAAACYQELIWLSDFLDTLSVEEPEVDLEKELGKWRHDHFKGKRDDDYNGEYLKRVSQLAIARHFYELGKNARKED